MRKLMKHHTMNWISERLLDAVEDFHDASGPIDRRMRLAHVARLRGRLADLELPVITSTEHQPSRAARILRARALMAGGDLLIERAEEVLGAA